MGIFQTATMKLTDAAGNQIAGGASLPCQVDNLSIPYQMGGDMSAIAFDRYTIYSLGWTSPVPVRGNLLTDLTTGMVYAVEGNVAKYSNHLEMQVANMPSGSTP